MSKTTKIIAALGVVAGLGVAALPAFTYAAQPISGAVKLDVEVQPSIAMTIHSNGDAENTYYYAEDPDNAAAGYINLTEAGKTYTEYTKDETPKFNVWSSATTTILPNQTKEDMSSTITVYTNATNYSLSVIDEDENNNLVNITGTGGETIAPIAQEATLTAGTAGGQWGLKGGSVSAYTAVPRSNAGALALVSSADASKTGAATTVTYGVATDKTQAVGHYQDVIVYTATAQ